MCWISLLGLKFFYELVKDGLSVALASYITNVWLKWLGMFAEPRVPNSKY